MADIQQTTALATIHLISVTRVCFTVLRRSMVPRRPRLAIIYGWRAFMGIPRPRRDTINEQIDFLKKMRASASKSQRHFLFYIRIEWFHWLLTANLLCWSVDNTGILRRARSCFKFRGWLGILKVRKVTTETRCHGERRRPVPFIAERTRPRLITDSLMLAPERSWMQMG